VRRLIDHEAVLLGSSHHDFNQYVWPPEGSLDANANWQILSVNPLVFLRILTMSLQSPAPPATVTAQPAASAVQNQPPNVARKQRPLILCLLFS
jgi:hypothetical protein